MGSRAYRRDSRGRFAGAEGGTHVTFGRAGGFASATHRGNVAQTKASRARRRMLARRAVKVTSEAAAVGAAVAIGVGVRAVARRSL